MGVVRDLTEQRFGNLTFERRLRVDERRRSVWQARCDCGNVTEVVGTRVTSGHVASCGCRATNVALDLAGQRFERLVAIRPDGRYQSRAITWRCRCDCGNEVSVPGPKLKFGHTRSCGCLQIDTIANLNRSHGMSDSGTYSTWLAMKARCTNPDAENYSNYGGRGIRVCDRWVESFEAFLADMGERPEGLTIERMDNDGDYEPGNCRWATRLDQNRNQRRHAGKDWDR